MSKSPGPRGGSQKRGPQPSPEARRKQMLVALAMGLVMGVVISALTAFWWWLPAGLAVGLATGAIMKPPPD